MTKYDFTLEDLRREVLALADERPDFVYTAQKEREGLGASASCSYTGALMDSTEGEACIFGQALTRLGVPQDVLMGRNQSISTILRDHFDFDIPDAYFLVDATGVQAAQDGGVPWGKAVAPFRKRLTASV